MAKYNCKKLVSSSSATVYGQPKKIPCVEDFELKAMNPYGRTKLFLEEIARDIQNSDREWKIILLGYFNPVGAYIIIINLFFQHLKMNGMDLFLFDWMKWNQEWMEELRRNGIWNGMVKCS
ncbi:hypothetical protein LXL04_035702 [Taraxacum kok-saghyz]